MTTLGAQIFAQELAKMPRGLAWAEAVGAPIAALAKRLRDQPATRPIPLRKAAPVEQYELVAKQARDDSIYQRAQEAVATAKRMGIPNLPADERASVIAKVDEMLGDADVYDAYTFILAGEPWPGTKIVKAAPSTDDLRPIIKKFVREKRWDELNAAMKLEGGEALAAAYEDLQYSGELSPPRT